MRKLLLALGLWLGAGLAAAVEPVSIIPWLPESTYDVTQSTVAISSQTVSWDAAVSGYRTVHIANLSATATLYYRVDGSTASTGLVGYPILPSTLGQIESNAMIGYQLGASATVGSIDVRKKVIRK